MKLNRSLALSLGVIALFALIALVLGLFGVDLLTRLLVAAAIALSVALVVGAIRRRAAKRQLTQ